jgi:hypothetical protein
MKRPENLVVQVVWINYNPKIDRIAGWYNNCKSQMGKGSEFSLLIHYPKDKSGIKDVTTIKKNTMDT